MIEKASSGIVAATRIAAGDDRTRYDSFAIALHWLTVALVLVQFGLGELWDFAPRPVHHFMVLAHMSFGILLALVVILRIIWRFIPGHQVTAANSGVLEIAAKAVHYLLYVLLIAQAVLGFLMRWGGHEEMFFFGLWIPPFFAPFGKPTVHFIGELHENIGWAIIIIALGHAAAALFHHFFLRDDVLRRMMPNRQT